VVINKIDKPAANPERCHEEVLELFLELGANEEQINSKLSTPFLEKVLRK